MIWFRSALHKHTLPIVGFTWSVTVFAVHLLIVLSESTGRSCVYFHLPIGHLTWRCQAMQSRAGFLVSVFLSLGLRLLCRRNLQHRSSSSPKSIHERNASIIRESTSINIGRDHNMKSVPGCFDDPSATCLPTFESETQRNTHTAVVTKADSRWLVVGNVVTQ